MNELSRSEFVPRSEAEKTRNMSIALKVNDIINKPIKIRDSAREMTQKELDTFFISNLISDNFKLTVFSERALEKVDDPNTRLFLFAARSDGAMQFDPFDLAKTHGFNYPIYALEFKLPDIQATASTPYGKMPKLARDSNDKLYHFYNIYFFDGSGKAARYEGVLQVSEEFTKDLPLKLSIPVTEADERMVSVEDEDYEQILMTLNEVKSGEFYNYIT